jgi:outer membrane murein-binding lipoprotein Lpp
MRTWIRIAAFSAAALSLAGCSSEITKSSSPVELIATNTQTLNRIDVLANAQNCNQPVGTIQVQAIIKNPASQTTNSTFEQVKLSSYNVSYVRTDNGKTVPASFTRSIDGLLTPGGGATSLNSFLILQPEALNQAPFAALLPQNGGRDPDTLSSTIHMDVVVTIFGQTLAGDNVSASTRFPLDFCYNCNGCL